MANKKAKMAAWAIMALLAGLLAFIMRASVAAFAVMAGIFAVYGFVSFGDDLGRFLGQPDGGGHKRKRVQG